MPDHLNINGRQDSANAGDDVKATSLEDLGNGKKSEKRMTTTKGPSKGTLKRIWITSGLNTMTILMMLK